MLGLYIGAGLLVIDLLIRVHEYRTGNKFKIRVRFKLNGPYKNRTVYGKKFDDVALYPSRFKADKIESYVVLSRGIYGNWKYVVGKDY